MPGSFALLIGVSTVAGLPPLRGVQSALAGFTTWAVGQGFDVERFDDLHGQGVTIGALQRCVKSVVQQQRPERVFVFFYGHGIMRGINEEYWLLSDARATDTEAINVVKSAEMVRQCAAGHAAFFGEACRTAAAGEFSHVSGGSLFPASGLDGDTQLDRFHAARFDAAAFEAAGEGIFSTHLIDSLCGRVPAVIETITNGPAPSAVKASRLARFLPLQVQREASRRLLREQRPDCRAGSTYEPYVLAWLPPLRSTSVDPANLRPPRAPLPTWEDADGGPLSGIGDGDVPDLTKPASVSIADDVAAVATLAQRYLATSSPELAAQTGVTVTGARICRAIIGGSDDETIRDDGTVHIHSSEEVPDAALLRFGGSKRGDWAGLGTFPGYAAALTVREVPFGDGDVALAVDHIAYLPASTARVTIAATEVAEQIADVSARLRLGVFDPAELNETAKVALYGDLNPGLAVLVAHAWSHIGRLDKIRELLTRFLDAQQTVPFDMPLLAHVPWEEVGTAVVPGFPLMTRGWALLDSLPAGAEVLNAARRLRVSSPWTSFHHLSAQLATELAQSTVTRSTDARDLVPV